MARRSSFQLDKMVESWADREGRVCSNSEILEWVDTLNRTVRVEIKKNRLSDSNFWFYDNKSGVIKNRNESFFKIAGLKGVRNHETYLEQPVILQDEIGMLGFICKEFDGVPHFLVQAKIEPGNINKIQLSPTIQATKSNFTQKHGGKRPMYIDYFIDDRYEIIADRIQSEQSSRFLKKRNRNIIIKVDEEVPTTPAHKWMTLGQIKSFMRIDNLVNMDSRTVISSIPYSNEVWTDVEKERLDVFCSEKHIMHSLTEKIDNGHLHGVYKKIDDYRMFDDSSTEIVGLTSLTNWTFNDEGIVCKAPYHFKVVFCDISIEGREVQHWTQPLFQANGIATFALMLCESQGKTEFVVRLVPELGCFDKVELGPTIQQEAGTTLPDNKINKLFIEKMGKHEGVLFDHLLSEEGGRFYHEQNRNILLRVAEEELERLPEGYFLVSLAEMVRFIQDNNTVNIQLRNLISLLEV